MYCINGLKSEIIAEKVDSPAHTFRKINRFPLQDEHSFIRSANVISLFIGITL